jgi:hypothetical protein
MTIFKKILKGVGIFFFALVPLAQGLPLYDGDIPQQCVEKNLNKISPDNSINCNQFDIQLSHDSFFSGSSASEAIVVIPHAIAKIQNI